MVQITLLEIHLDDSTLSASSPFGPGEKKLTAGDAPREEGGSRGGAIAALIGLVFLGAVAYMVKRKVLDDDELENELEMEEVPA